MKKLSARCPRSLLVLSSGSVRLNLLAAGATLAALASVSGPALGESVQQIGGPPGHVIWQINEPTINKASTDYPQIVFSPAKTVTVTASGCVQTGGHGLTWKRYVDPAGDQSDTLYHGQLSIPGATNGLVDFDPRQPTVYTIPANASPSHLVLGYTDDHLGDNTYNSHDNGDDNQCWEVGPAQVKIDIGPPLPPNAAPAQSSYTLTIDGIMVRNLRTHHPTGGGKDTDVIATSVVVNGTPANVAGQTIGDIEQGPHPVSFPLVVTQVRPHDRLDFVYTIVNAGNPTSQATTSTVTGVISKGVSVVPIAGSFLSALTTGAGDLINYFNADCDGPVVAGSIMATGADLALWTQNGPYTRTRAFPGLDSHDGCGSNSFYEVTYTISRGDVGTQPYSAHVNVPTLSTSIGSKTREFRK